MPEQTILITGATGLLGSHVARLLFLRGHTRISALKRPSSRMDLVRDIEKHINWIEADITDPEAIHDAVGGVSQVIHSAALIAFGKRNLDRLRKINVTGTANIVNACLENGVQRLLHVSSIAAFTRTGKKQWIDESTPWLKTRYTSDYGRSKYDSELEVFRGMAEGLDVQIVNPAIVLGSGFWGEGSLEMIDKAAKGISIYPSGSMGFVDVRDIALLISRMIETGQFTGQKVIASGHNRTYREIFAEIGEHFGHNAPTMELKPVIGEIAWRILEPLGTLTNSEPLLSKQNVRTTACRISYDNSRSRQVNGFDYTELSETIADIAAIYKKSAAENWAPIPMSFRAEHIA